jgi:ABC-type transporter Mla maintaining outer membrane lipid asymmetry permease subunit MlaE
MMVCSGVLMGWYGADVTPGIFYENFIELMVTIDVGNGSLRAVISPRGT